MLTVYTAGQPSQFNTIGYLVCNNGGALFSNNKSTTPETVSNVTAQWNIPDNVYCYTGS